MLSLLPLLLAALLALTTVQSADLQTSSSNISNATLSNIGVPWRGGKLTNCRYPGTNLSPYDSCVCFNGNGKTVGVDRAFMNDAIWEACQQLTGGIRDPASVYGMADGLPREATQTHSYTPNHSHEEGRIFIALRVALDSAKCAGPITISRDGCWDILHYSLDTCDMAGENGKHGGIVQDMDGCVYWVLDPNPGVNAPYEGLLGP